MNAPDKVVGVDAVEESQHALLQTMAVIEKALPEIELSPNLRGRCFLGHRGPDGSPGIRALLCEIQDDESLTLRTELVSFEGEIRVPASAVFGQLAGITEHGGLYSTQEKGRTTLGVNLQIHPSPMGFLRQSRLSAALDQLNTVAAALQSELAVRTDDTNLTKQYAKFEDALEPIFPHSTDLVALPESLQSWADTSIGYLEAGLSLALASPYRSALSCAATSLATAGSTRQRTFGRIRLPLIDTKRLMTLADKAPGGIVLPASALSFGSNPYDLGREIQAMLKGLLERGHAAVFMGTLEELQSIFSGGQGAICDPLLPMIRHVPTIPLDVLCAHEVNMAARHAGSLSVASQQALTERALELTKTTDRGESCRILPATVRRLLAATQTGTPDEALPDFVSDLKRTSETLGGIPARPRVERAQHVQGHLVRELTDSGLLQFFTDTLYAQDAALTALVERLRTESLARDAHQPLRYCAQGTPGTGKSQSAVMLARRLDIPYVNIDAASMPDYHTATSQLLGSGRGIVGSFQSGRLEQAAKHHRGCVLEISDIDHAPPHVRGPLADLFLQVLETGEAQSATGAMFSCANLIFAFTMNLPDGLDETVRKQIGFHDTPSRQDIEASVTAELRKMLSGAFLSRVGTPIIFDALDTNAMARIAEEAIQSTVTSALAQLGLSPAALTVSDGTGHQLLDALEAHSGSYGARVILEKARTLATEAVLEASRKGPDPTGKAVTVIVTETGTLQLKTTGE